MKSLRQEKGDSKNALLLKGSIMHHFIPKKHLIE